MKNTRNYCGSLDFAEFIIDPTNERTSPEEFGAMIGSYIRIIGGWENGDWEDFRKRIYHELKSRRADEDAKHDLALLNTIPK